MTLWLFAISLIIVDTVVPVSVAETSPLRRTRSPLKPLKPFILSLDVS